MDMFAERRAVWGRVRRGTHQRARCHAAAAVTAHSKFTTAASYTKVGRPDVALPPPKPCGTELGPLPVIEAEATRVTRPGPPLAGTALAATRRGDALAGNILHQGGKACTVRCEHGPG